MPVGAERQGDRLQAYKNKGKDSEVSQVTLIPGFIFVYVIFLS